MQYSIIVFQPLAQHWNGSDDAPEPTNVFTKTKVFDGNPSNSKVVYNILLLWTVCITDYRYMFGLSCKSSIAHHTVDIRILICFGQCDEYRAWLTENMNAFDDPEFVIVFSYPMCFSSQCLFLLLPRQKILTSDSNMHAFSGLPGNV